MERLPTTPHDAVFRRNADAKRSPRLSGYRLPEDFLAICDLDSLNWSQGVLLKTIYAAAIQIFSTLYAYQHGPGMFYAH